MQEVSLPISTLNDKSFGDSKEQMETVLQIILPPLSHLTHTNLWLAMCLDQQIEETNTHPQTN